MTANLLDHSSLLFREVDSFSAIVWSGLFNWKSVFACLFSLYRPISPFGALLAQFSRALSTISSLCMRLHRWDLSPPSPCTDLVLDYYAAANWDRTDDEKRAARQWAKFDVGDSETVTGKDGAILDPPSKMGHSFPPCPLGIG